MTTEKQSYARDWLVVVLLLCTMVFSFIDRFGMSVFVGPLKQDLGITDAHIGLLHGLPFGIFYAFMGIPFGWLADRWSRKYTIAIGVTIWSLATTASSFCGSFGLLLAARIWVGAGEAALAPAAYGIVHSRFPPRLLGRAMSVFQLGALVGSGLAVTVAGFIFSQFELGRIAVPFFSNMRPWQETFFVLGLPGIILVPLILLIGKTEGPAKSRKPEKGMLGAALLSAWPLYLTSFLAMSMLNMTTYTLVSWIPAMIEREFAMGAKDVGASYGLVVIVACPLGLLFGGWLADRFVSPDRPANYLNIPLVAAIMALPALLLVAHMSSLNMLLLSLAGLHFALSMPIGVIPAFLQIITPDGVKGRVSALYVLIVNVFRTWLGADPGGTFSAASPNAVGALRQAIFMTALPAIILAISILGSSLVSRRRRSAVPV